MTVSSIVSNGKNLKCDFREKEHCENSGHGGVTQQGPVIVPQLIPSFLTTQPPSKEGRAVNESWASVHRRKLRLVDGDAFPRILHGKCETELRGDRALVPRNLDLISSPKNLLSKHHLPQGIFPPLPTYRVS